MIVYIDNSWTLSYYDGNPITGGQPGVGVYNAPLSNGISAIDIGHLDTLAPTPINAQQVGTSVFPTHVDFQFPGAVDDPNGGVMNLGMKSQDPPRTTFELPTLGP